jgi:hypothetical protein
MTTAPAACATHRASQVVAGIADEGGAEEPSPHYFSLETGRTRLCHCRVLRRARACALRCMDSCTAAGSPPHVSVLPDKAPFLCKSPLPRATAPKGRYATFAPRAVITALDLAAGEAFQQLRAETVEASTRACRLRARGSTWGRPVLTHEALAGGRCSWATAALDQGTRSVGAQAPPAHGQNTVGAFAINLQNRMYNLWTTWDGIAELG